MWPRRSLDARWWRWRVIISHKWSDTGNHINKLELRSLLSAIRWRARAPSRQGKKFFHLTDSAVAMGVVARARSSSFDLQLPSDKVNSTLLAAGLCLILAHVDTKRNPADAPSRTVLGRKIKQAGREPIPQASP